MFEQLILTVTEKSPKFLDGYRAPLAICFVAFLATVLLTPLIRNFAISRGAVNDPTGDARRVHTEPMPMWGGVALYLGIVISMLVILPFAYPEKPLHPYLFSILFVGLLIVIAGMIDDVRSLPAKYQALFLLACGFLVQILAGPGDHLQITGIENIFVRMPDGEQGWIPFGVFSWPITAIYIFCVTKITDTIDGLDGLAAGIAVISATTLALIGVFSGQPRVALIGASIAGASLGFLRYNFNPARIFMGTAGSQLLGFMLACTSIVGTIKTAATLALIVPVFIFGVPFFDAIFVIVRRVRSGVPITQADKRHVHHSLMDSGLSQRQTVMVLYLAALGLCSAIMFIIVSLYS